LKTSVLNLEGGEGREWDGMYEKYDKYEISGDIGPLGVIMHGDPVIGSAKVGSRGQIVLPVDIRKSCGIDEGDTMIVMARPGPGGWNVVLMKASEMAGFLDHMEGTSKRIRSMIGETKDPSG